MLRRMLNKKTRIKGSVKLSAIGDALGYITERTKTTDQLKIRCGVTEIDRFYDWKMPRSRFGDSLEEMPSGSYSDDTQLMLTVARSIQSDGTIDQHFFAKKELSAWRFYRQGAGSTISAAALKINRKSADWSSNFFTYKRSDGSKRDYRDCAANGAAMRISPIALANVQDFGKMKEQLFGNSIVTHGHPRAIIGALLYGYTIHQVFNYTTNTFNPNLFLKKIMSSFKSELDLLFLSRPKFKEWIKTWNDNSPKRDFSSEYDMVLDEVEKSLKKVHSGLQQGGSLRDLYNDLSSFTKPTKGYGTNTVIAAICILCKYHNNPVDGIVESVNMLGSDTDTIASIAGGMLGALHGEQIIPDKWKSVQDYQYLDWVGNRIFEIILRTDKSPKPAKCSLPIFDLNKGNYSKLTVGSQICIDPLGKGTIQDITTKTSTRPGKKKIYINIKFDIGQTCTIPKLVPE